MALTKTASPAFEDMGNEDGVAETVAHKPTADERVAAAAAKAAAAKPSESTEVAAVKPAAVSVASIAQANPFTPLKNALKVDYNTLPRIMATNGNFQNKENKKLLGDTVTLELLSWQEHYVLSPGGLQSDEESLQFLKYSEDGITSQEGESMAACLQAAKESGYPKAAIKKRTILVGALVNPGKLADMQDDLVQMDLAPNSARNFNQHQVTTAYKVGKGKMVKEGAEIMKLFTVVKDENKLQWTEVGFSVA